MSVLRAIARLAVRAVRAAGHPPSHPNSASRLHQLRCSPALLGRSRGRHERPLPGGSNQTIDWPEFFRISCRHREGYLFKMSYTAAVEHPGADLMPRPLFMVDLPAGPGMSVEAREWLEEAKQ